MTDKKFRLASDITVARYNSNLSLLVELENAVRGYNDKELLESLSKQKIDLAKSFNKRCYKSVSVSWTRVSSSEWKTSCV